MPQETAQPPDTAEHDPLILHAGAISRASHLAIADTDPRVTSQALSTPEALDSPEKIVENIRRQLAVILDDYLLAKRNMWDGERILDPIYEPSNISKEPALVVFNPSGALLPENLWEVSQIAITPDNKILGERTQKPYDGWRPLTSSYQAGINNCSVEHEPSPHNIEGFNEQPWEPLSLEQQTSLLAFLEHFTPTPEQPVTVDQMHLYPHSDHPSKKDYISPSGNRISVKRDATLYDRYKGTRVNVAKWNGRPSRNRNGPRKVRTTLTAHDI